MTSQRLFARNIIKNSFAVTDISHFVLCNFLNVFFKLFAGVALYLIQILSLNFYNINLLVKLVKLRLFVGYLNVLIDYSDNGVKSKSDNCKI